MDPSQPTRDSDRKTAAVESDRNEQPVAKATSDTSQERIQITKTDADATRHEPELRIHEQLEGNITDSQPVHDIRRVDESLKQESPLHLDHAPETTGASANLNADRRDDAGEPSREPIHPDNHAGITLRLRKFHSQPEIAHYSLKKRIFIDPFHARGGGGDSAADVEAQKCENPLPPHPPDDHHGKAPLPHLVHAFERDMRLWHEEREMSANRKQEQERERSNMLAGDERNVSEDEVYDTYTNSPPLNVPPAIAIPPMIANRSQIYDQTPLTGVPPHSGSQSSSENPVVQLIATLMSRGSDNFRSDLGRLLGELQSEHVRGNGHAKTQEGVNHFSSQIATAGGDFLDVRFSQRQNPPSGRWLKQNERETVSISIQQPDEDTTLAASAVAVAPAPTSASVAIDGQDVNTASKLQAGLAGIGSGNNTLRDQNKIDRLSARRAEIPGPGLGLGSGLGRRRSSAYSDAAGGHATNINHHYATSLPGGDTYTYTYSPHGDERYQRTGLHPDVLPMRRNPDKSKQGVQGAQGVRYSSSNNTVGDAAGGDGGGEDDKTAVVVRQSESKLIRILNFLREWYIIRADNRKKALEEGRADVLANSVHDHLFYTRAVALEEEKTYRRKATRLGWYLNLAITAQLFLNAIVTGLSASGSSKHAVSVLGGFGTAVSGYIARARGSNEPYTSMIIVVDLKKFIRDIDGFIQDHGKERSRDYNEYILAYRERFEKILGNITEYDEKLKARKSSRD